MCSTPWKARQAPIVSPAGEALQIFPAIRLHLRRSDDTVHIHRRPKIKPRLRVIAQIIGAFQVLHIHQELWSQMSIPHANKNVRSPQEWTRFIKMPGQEFAGFVQGRWPDIIKFRQCRMHIYGHRTFLIRKAPLEGLKNAITIMSYSVVIDSYSLWHFVQPHSIVKCTILPMMIVMIGRKNKVEATRFRL
jgi:hypothetical protein